MSGARRKELLEVRWPDLGWPDAVGDAGELVIACRDGGKTALARRRFALDPRTVGELATWRDERLAAASAVLDDRGHVFSADPSGEPVWHPAWVTRQVAALSAQTGVCVSIMALRRYSLVRLSVLGVSPYVIGRRLGWSPDVTVRSCAPGWSAASILAADRAAALLLANELDQAAAGAACDD